MLKKRENLKDSRVRLTITSIAKSYTHAFDHVALEAGKTVKITGFRPGKAPVAKVIEKLGRVALESEALDHLISDDYYDTIKAEKLIPTDRPDIKIVEFTAPEKDADDEKIVLTFTAEFDVLPEVKIDGWQKIRVKKAKGTEVKEDEVTRVIDYLRKQKAKVEPADPDAKAEKDMWVDVAYEGSVDGVKRTDMLNKNHPLVIGEGQLIPGFEEELIGMKVGDVKTFKITFPKDYQAKELAGKKAEFTVNINELKNVVLPEIDVEFAKAFGHDTTEALLAAIKDNLVEEKAEQDKSALEEQIIDQFLKIAKFELPASLVEQELERLFADSKARLEKMQFNWDNYLSQTGKTMEQLKEEMTPQAEKNVKVGLALGKLIQEEGLGESEKAGTLAVERLVEIATS